MNTSSIIPSLLDNPFNRGTNNKDASEKVHHDLKVISQAVFLSVSDKGEIREIDFIEWVWERIRGICGFIDHANPTLLRLRVKQFLAESAELGLFTLADCIGPESLINAVAQNLGIFPEEASKIRDFEEMSELISAIVAKTLKPEMEAPNYQYWVQKYKMRHIRDLEPHTLIARVWLEWIDFLMMDEGPAADGTNFSANLTNTFQNDRLVPGATRQVSVLDPSSNQPQEMSHAAVKSRKSSSWMKRIGMTILGIGSFSVAAFYSKAGLEYLKKLSVKIADPTNQDPGMDSSDDIPEDPSNQNQDPLKQDQNTSNQDPLNQDQNTLNQDPTLSDQNNPPPTPVDTPSVNENNLPLQTDGSYMNTWFLVSSIAVGVILLGATAAWYMNSGKKKATKGSRGTDSSSDLSGGGSGSTGSTSLTTPGTTVSSNFGGIGSAPGLSQGAVSSSLNLSATASQGSSGSLDGKKGFLSLQVPEKGADETKEKQSPPKGKQVAGRVHKPKAKKKAQIQPRDRQAVQGEEGELNLGGLFGASSDQVEEKPKVPEATTAANQPKPDAKPTGAEGLPSLVLTASAPDSLNQFILLGNPGAETAAEKKEPKRQATLPPEQTAAIKHALTAKEQAEIFKKELTRQQQAHAASTPPVPKTQSTTTSTSNLPVSTLRAPTDVSLLEAGFEPLGETETPKDDKSNESQNVPYAGSRTVDATKLKYSRITSTGEETRTTGRSPPYITTSTSATPSIVTSQGTPHASPTKKEG